MENMDTVYLHVYNMFPYAIREFIGYYGKYPHGQVIVRVLLGED
jgi:hypothetical protein